MSVSPAGRPGAGPMKAFRLSDVPEKIRLRAASYLVQRVTVDLDATPGTGMGLLGERIGIERAARHPSPTVYMVSAAAWEAMLARAGKLR